MAIPTPQGFPPSNVDMCLELQLHACTANITLVLEKDENTKPS